MSRLIVTGGRLDHRAAVATAVWAFDILRYTAPALSLVVAGDGPERERLMRFARAAGGGEVIPVAFDTVPPEQFNVAAQVWVPHHRGGTRLALAAMAAGRPVVAADTPELRELVGDAGRFFPPGDRARLAAVGYDLLTHPADAAALGEAGRRRAVAHFPAYRLADALAAVYYEAALSPPARWSSCGRRS